MNFALHCVRFFSLWLSQLEEFLGFKNSLEADIMQLAACIGGREEG